MNGIYVRISTEEQSQYSISSQLKACRQKAQSPTVKEYIDDGYSGEFLDRPGLSKLRQDIRDGIITKVICYDPDRLSRKLMNQLILTDEFDKCGVEIVFVSGEYQKTPEGSLFYQLRGAIAEFEKAKINERMSRGRREKARQGKVVRDYQIYGYGYDKEIGNYYILEDEARIVRLIFDLFTSPNMVTYTDKGEEIKVKGINGIAKYLTHQGIPTKRGAKVWHRQVVRQILLNESYTGIFYQNRWDTEGMLGNKYRDPEDRVRIKERPREEWIPIKIPVIINKEQFEHAQRLINESKRRFAKSGNREYLLSGLLRCGNCGNTLTGKRANNWGKYVFQYTDVKNYSGAKFSGCGFNIRCDKIDEIVWEHVKDYINNYEEILNAELEASATSYEANELERVNKQIEKVKEGRKRLIKLFSLGDVELGEDEIRNELKSLKEQEDKLLARQRELEDILEQNKSGIQSKRILEEAVNYYMGIGSNDLTFEDKQNLIRFIVREIVLYDDDVKIYTW